VQQPQVSRERLNIKSSSNTIYFALYLFHSIFFPEGGRIQFIYTFIIARVLDPYSFDTDTDPDPAF
jgi:hypothetical protein